MTDPSDMTLAWQLMNLVEGDGGPDELAATEGPLSPSRVANALRMGIRPTDRVFDRFLSDELRVVSSQYWTPLAVAMRAAEWITHLKIRTVVDIGSGAGKFCVVAALAGEAYFIGVEQRARLVAAAGDLARVLEVGDRVTFVNATFGEDVVPKAEVYYLYNPFGENLFDADDYLDEDVELGDARYGRDIAAVEHLLRKAPIGTYLLTYNGFGGEIPGSYREVWVDRDLPAVLRLWRRTSRASFGQPQPADAP